MSYNAFLSIDPDDGNINDNGRATPTETVWVDDFINEDTSNQPNPRLSFDPCHVHVFTITHPTIIKG